MNDGHAGGAGGGSFPNLDEFNFNIDEIDLDNISSELLAGPSQLSQMQSSATQTTSGDFLSRIPTGDLGVPSQATMSYGSALSQQPQAIDPSVVEHFRHQLNPNPIQPPGVPQPLAPPNPMPTSTEAAVPASSDSTAPLILKGRDIQELMVDSVNFICGCSGFMPLQNELFLEVVREHFIERLKDPRFYAMCEKRYPVRDEVVPIIERARAYSRTNDVRIWTVVGKNRLRESNWLEFDFEDVTNNAVRRRERLESPLRSVLTRLYLNSSSSKADRYPKSRGPLSAAKPLVPQSSMELSATSLGASNPLPTHQPASFQQSQGYNAPPAMAVQAQLPLDSYVSTSQVSVSSQISQGSYGQNAQINFPPQNNSRQRSHAEMMGMQQPTMVGQWGQLNTAAPSFMLTTPTLPVTDRHWEPAEETDGTILYEDAMTTELLEKLGRPRTYVASLSSVMNEQMKDQANTLLARKIAKRWLDEDPMKRWVCWIDAADPMTLTQSYRSAIKSLRGAASSFEQQVGQKRRLSPSAAAGEFLEEYVARFSSQFECAIVYINVGHPQIFVEGFLPSSWMHDMHCQSTMKGILLSTPHPMYEGSMGPPFGNSVVQHSVEWIPNWNESEKRYWWDRLPQSNLPPLLDDVDEPSGIERKLAFDGRAVALVEPGKERPDRAGDIANQFARRWEMAENADRFCIWLKASDEKSLRESFREAIRRVTHSTHETPLGNPVDLSLRVIGNELMSILMKVRELSPSKQWIMVFEDAKNDYPFHKKFFSGKSNWWNSKGRFIITSTRDDLHVEVQDQVKPVPIILV